MDRRRDEEENMVALYEASFNGCVNTLNTLIQKDALILYKVSLTSFTETPLHIVALLGHLEFTRALVNKKPKLAKEADSLGRTPLHLASAEGHTKIVRVLLRVNTDACLVSDQHGRIPLHLAATRGRGDILKELIIVRRDSILVNLNGDSVLHLCVRHNHLDALKFLVEFANRDELFLNSKDQDGNTILHLAVMLKQIKTIKYLLSILEMKREANAVNRIGNTALDVLEIYSRDFRFFEIQEMLKEAGVRRSIDLNPSPLTTPIHVAVDETQGQSEGSTRARSGRWWQYFLKTFKYQRNWMEETRGVLMVVATVIATKSFQAGTNPPGGVWQETKEVGPDSVEQNPRKAGTAVLSYSAEYKYLFFLWCNTISFLASMSVVLLIISGFPLKSMLVIWFLTVTMSIAVVSVIFTYIISVSMVTSDPVLENFLPTMKPEYILLGLVVAVAVIHVIRLLSWVINKLRVFKCKSTSAPSQISYPVGAIDSTPPTIHIPDSAPIIHIPDSPAANITIPVATDLSELPQPRMEIDSASDGRRGKKRLASGEVEAEDSMSSNAVVGFQPGQHQAGPSSFTPEQVVQQQDAFLTSCNASGSSGDRNLFVDVSPSNRESPSMW